MQKMGKVPTAVVTGANRGLGLALAERLTTMGVCVILTSRLGAAACHTRPRLPEQHLKVYEPPLDVSDPQSRTAFLRYCRDQGGVDILINNAAICIPGWSKDVVKTTLRTNLLGPVALINGLVPDMLQRDQGIVINISSGDGELVYLHSELQAAICAVESLRQLLRVLACASPPKNGFGHSPAHGPTPAYSMSKAALNVATRVLSQSLPRLTGRAIWMGAVCPGDVQTRMCTAPDHAISPEAAAQDVLWLLEQQLLGSRQLPSGHFWRSREEIQP